jgi:Flp pilus assembly protein TadG
VDGNEYQTPNPENLRMTSFSLRTFKKIRAGAGNKRGQSLVEFTLVMPVMLITMTGMLSFGMAMHDYLVLTNAVNTGAQALSMSRGQTTDPCATAAAAIESAAPSLVTANLTFKFVIDGNSYTTTSCSAGAADMVQGTTAQVSATYPCTLAIYGMNVPACTLGTKTAELIQ